MFSKFDKAYVSALVSFVSLTTMTFLGFELDPTLQAGIVAVISGAFTWLVPNKPA